MLRLRGSLTLAVLSLCLLAPSLALSKAQMQPAVEVKSSKGGVEDVFQQMMVSHDYKPDHPVANVQPGVDLIQYEADLFKGLSDGSLANHIPELKGAKPSDIEVVLIRYGIGDDTLVDNIVAAKKKGVDVKIITDLNLSLDGKFRPGEKESTDFKSAALKDTEPGRALKKFLGAGFEYRKDLMSQPLQSRGDGNDMAPIMHQKNLAIRDKRSGKVVLRLSSTGNLNSGAPRYNRTIVTRDPDLAAIGFEHDQAMIEAFQQGQSIKGIKSAPPKRLTFADGTFVQASYTDGRYNPNDEIAKLLQRAVSDAGNFKIKNITASHFVFTNSDVFNSMKQVLALHPQSTIDAVVDDKFATLRGWGMSPAFDGFNVYRPMGAPVLGWPKELQSRVNLRVYQRGVEGIEETDLDGAPIARHLWHDKTTVIRTIENGEEWVYVFTGSLNLSNHSDNAEEQLMFRFKGGSPIARAFEESIKKVADAEKEFAIAARRAILRSTIADMVGQSDLKVELTEADAIAQDIHDGKLLEAEAKIRTLYAKPNKLTKKLPPNEFEERIGRLKRFLQWVKAMPNGPDKLKAMSLKNLADMAIISFHPTMREGDIKFALRGALWSPGIQQADLDKLAEDAWNVLYPTHQSLAKAGAPANQVVSSLLKSALKPKKNVVAEIFDFDDTLMYLDTKVVLFETDAKGAFTGKTKEISTTELASIKDQLGKPGPYEHLKLDRVRDGGSYRNFHDPARGSNILDDIHAAMKRGQWQGPKWQEFVDALSTREGAERVSILSARGHSRDTFWQALNELKKLGLIKNVPKKENIFMVDNAESNPKDLSTEEAKAEILAGKADELRAEVKAGTIQGEPTLIFYDDTGTNVKKAVAAMTEEHAKHAKDDVVNFVAEHVGKQGVINRMEVGPAADKAAITAAEVANQSTQGVAKADDLPKKRTRAPAAGKTTTARAAVPKKTPGPKAKDCIKGQLAP